MRDNEAFPSVTFHFFLYYRISSSIITNIRASALSSADLRDQTSRLRSFVV